MLQGHIYYQKATSKKQRKKSEHMENSDNLNLKFEKN